MIFKAFLFGFLINYVSRNVSIRDTANTDNILCLVRSQSSAAGTVVNQSEYVSKPSWLTGNMTLGVYTAGGGGTPQEADFIFKEVSLYHKT